MKQKRDGGRGGRARGRKGGVGGCNGREKREEEYRVLILSLIHSLCKSQQSQEMPGPWLRLIATAITKGGFL